MSEAREFVKVGEKEYRIIKTGRAQAEQVAQLTKWIARHGSKVIRGLQESGSLDNVGGMEFIVRFLEALDADALVDLFVVVTGCSSEDAEVYFDVSDLVDVSLTIYQNQPAIGKLLDRFFSQPESGPATEEPSTI
jgi:hypothetical protein